MAEGVGNKGRLRRCFLIAQPGSGATAVATFLTERGIDTTRAASVPATGAIGAELLKYLAEADFVVAIWTRMASPNVAFELGVAHALGKPALVLALGDETPDLPGIVDLRGVNLVRVPDPRRLIDAAPEIDRFLRHAQAPPPIRPVPADPASSEQPGDMSWARERLVTIRTMKGARRGFAFEELVAEVFRRAGAEVASTNDETGAVSERDADLVVWLNDIVFDVGGPILVECKTYGGGSGSVTKNVEFTMRRMEKLIDASGAGLAFVVFDHDRPRTPPTIFETPQVLAFAAETLIEKLEHGSLATDVATRRRRAAFARGTAGGNA
jgi:hypothetical protein